MLVFSRRVGESIQIGENVTVTVVRITPGSIRLGVEAPHEMPVVREQAADDKQRAGEMDA